MWSSVPLLVATDRNEQLQLSINCVKCITWFTYANLPTKLKYALEFESYIWCRQPISLQIYHPRSAYIWGGVVSVSILRRTSGDKVDKLKIYWPMCTTFTPCLQPWSSIMQDVNKKTESARRPYEKTLSKGWTMIQFTSSPGICR